MRLSTYIIFIFCSLMFTLTQLSCEQPTGFRRQVNVQHNVKKKTPKSGGGESPFEPSINHPQDSVFSDTSRHPNQNSSAGQLLNLPPAESDPQTSSFGSSISLDAEGLFSDQSYPKVSELTPIKIDTYIDTSAGMKGFYPFLHNNVSTIVNKISQSFPEPHHFTWYQVAKNGTLRRDNSFFLKQGSYKRDSSLGKAFDDIFKRLKNPRTSSVSILITDGMAPDEDTKTDSCCSPKWSMRSTVDKIMQLIRNDYSINLHIINADFQGLYYMNCGVMSSDMSNAVSRRFGPPKHYPSKNSSLVLEDYKGQAPLMIYVITKHHKPALLTDVHKAFEAWGQNPTSIQIWPAVRSSNYELVSFLKATQTSKGSKEVPFENAASYKCYKNIQSQYEVGFQLQNKHIRSNKNIYDLVGFSLDVTSNDKKYLAPNLKAPTFEELSQIFAKPTSRKALYSSRFQCRDYYNMLSAKGWQPRSKESMKSKNFFSDCLCMFPSAMNRTPVEINFNVKISLGVQPAISELIQAYDDSREKCDGIDPTRIFGWKKYIEDLRKEISVYYKELKANSCVDPSTCSTDKTLTKKLTIQIQ